MSKLSELILPTLVLMGIFAPEAGALPTDPSPDFTEPAPPQYQPADVDSSKRDLIDITPPPASAFGIRKNHPGPDYFYKYHHEFGLQMGALYDTEGRGSENHLHETVSMRYLYPDHKLQPWEWNATFITDSTATLSFSRRFIASQDRYRPYSALGLGLHLLPDSLLANLLLWRQYQLRGAVGFEWTSLIFDHETQWRAEAALALSARSQQIDTSIGYVWPW